MSYSTEVRWVPQNMKKFREVLHLKGKETPCLHGLPVFNIFYSEPKKGNDDIVNRLTDNYGNYLGNNYLHAFRIIVGCTWNWFMANIAGYKLEIADLNYTITSLCRQCAGIKKDDPKPWKWNELLGCDKDDFRFKEIEMLKTSILQLYMEFDASKNDHWVSVMKWFSSNLSKYVLQDNAKLTLIPIDIQRKYRREYGNKAEEVYVEKHHKHFTMEVGLTLDRESWFAALIHKVGAETAERVLRYETFASGKVQRNMLNGAGINSKKKHARNSKSPKASPKRQLRCRSGNFGETDLKAKPERSESESERTTVNLTFDNINFNNCYYKSSSSC